MWVAGSWGLPPGPGASPVGSQFLGDVGQLWLPPKQESWTVLLVGPCLAERPPNLPVSRCVPEHVLRAWPGGARLRPQRSGVGWMAPLL